MSDDNNCQDAIFAKLNELDDEIKRLRREQIENIKSIKNLEIIMKKEIGRSTTENVAYTAGVSLMTAGITLAITDLTKIVFGTIVWIAGAIFMILYYRQYHGTKSSSSKSKKPATRTTRL